MHDEFKSKAYRPAFAEIHIAHNLACQDCFDEAAEKMEELLRWRETQFCPMDTDSCQSGYILNLMTLLHIANVLHHRADVIMSCLGRIRALQRRYDESLQLYEKALQLYLSTLQQA